MLELLANIFQGVTNAFGDNATLYRLDIGRVYESVQSGDLVVAGQFVDRSDGEIFNFEINQGTNKVDYKSTGDFLDKNALSLFLGDEAGSGDAYDSNSESSKSGPYPFDLLLQAINEESSEAYQSPFGSKLRKDLDYLGALSALMYHAGATIEAQPLYTGLHSYAIKYALGGLRLFSQSIGSIQGSEAGQAAEAWVDDHGLDFAAAVVKEFSSRRCVHFQESIQSEQQEGIQELKDLVEEAIGMAMATTTDLIKSVVEADDYQSGDVQATLAAAIEEYCPVDNSEGYNSVDNARQLSAEWQEVVSRSGCVEDLSLSAIGLPAAQIISSEQRSAHEQTTEPFQDSGTDEDTELAGERIFYVNVGEGPSRNWDDCRKFGFLAAGGGRKWSKQLEKIQIGDTVIAYLKGYGYVGIGKVTSTATPATKFMVNGLLIKELPLINDTIRSIKRFSKENGEYLIGIDWQVAVPREQAAWQANAGLYTTALVCASLSNQPDTISFVLQHLRRPLQVGLDQTKSRGETMENKQAAPTTLQYINGSSYYNPNDYGWDISEAFTFTPGRYFLGDPAHALTGDQYTEACEINYNSSGYIEGVGEIAVFKCPGDGQYVDEDGCAYSVGSGTLGVVPISHLSSEQTLALKAHGRILEDDGEDFTAMIDSQGHIFLGAAWIFCGGEHPLKHEFWEFLGKNDLDDIDICNHDFSPSEVKKVVWSNDAYYLGYATLTKNLSVLSFALDRVIP
ncbi:MAG: hypothetical protein WCF98_06475 [Synechococcus sp. ELA057]